jgi:hypothetical protein
VSMIENIAKSRHYYAISVPHKDLENFEKLLINLTDIVAHKDNAVLIMILVTTMCLF